MGKETTAQRVGRRLLEAKARCGFPPTIEVYSMLSQEQFKKMWPPELDCLLSDAEWGAATYGLTLAELFAEEEPKI